MRPVKGVLPIAIQARAMGLDGMLVPTENAAEAAVVDGLKIYPIANLREAAAFLEGREEIEPKNLLRMAMSELNLSARAYDRILKFSRTIADLAGADEITSEHLSETLQYRTLDRQLWG